MLFIDRLRRFLGGIRQDCKPLAQNTLKMALEKMDLVAREEFDAQRRVLEKAQAKLKELQLRLETLQKKAAPQEKE